MTEDFTGSIDQSRSHIEAIADLGTEVPEINSDYELISVMANSLVESYSIDPEFFKDKTKTLLFSALAQRLGQVRAQPDMPGEQRIHEELFINNALILLLRDHTPLAQNHKLDIDKSSDISEESVLHIYDRYTNHQLTAELEQAVAAGLFGDLAQRLGVLPDTQDAFGLRVMSLGTDTMTHGLIPPMTSEMELDWQDPGWDDTALAQNYIKDLSQRAQQFSAEVKQEINEGHIAWRLRLGNRQFMCIPQPIAEKILHTDQKRADYYEANNMREGELAAIKHEYVHTQRDISADEDGFFGLSMEERRAEYFSGDRLGYKDVKGFFDDVNVLTGFNFTDFLEQHRQATKEETYIDLANTFDLQTLLEMSLIVPRPYLSDNRSLQKQANQHLGGYDAVLARIYKKQVAAGHQGAMQTRINQGARYLKSEPDRFANWLNYRRGTLKLNFMADLYIKSAGFDPTLS